MTVRHLEGFPHEQYRQKIGTVAATWAYLEAALEVAMFSFSGVDFARGRPVTAQMEASRRIRILETLVNTYGSPQEQAALKPILADIDAARVERNDVLHGVWSPADDQGEEAGRAASWHSDAVRFDVTPKTDQELDRLIRRLSEAISTLQSIVSNRGASPLA